MKEITLRHLGNAQTRNRNPGRVRHTLGDLVALCFSILGLHRPLVADRQIRPGLNSPKVQVPRPGGAGAAVGDALVPPGLWGGVGRRDGG
jgi:hypothetical protein